VKAALALVALLLAPVLPPADGVAPMPRECELVDPTTLACRWAYEPMTEGTTAYWEIPLFDRTLATVGVTLLQAPDQGWRIRLAAGELPSEILSEAYHPARPTTALRHGEETTHVVEAAGNTTHWLVIDSGWAEAANMGNTLGSRAGRYEITYVGRLIPSGVAPERPAATAQAPHLLDVVAEVVRPAWDIRGAWWGDESLGDGLMDVHMRVASLSGIGEEDFTPPIAEDVPVAPSERRLLWRAHWRLGETDYHLQWRLDESGSIGDGLSACTLHAQVDAGASASPILAHALCSADIENATLHASFPIATIGSPPDGALFSGLRATTAIAYGANEPDSLDAVESPQFPFALGGPRVWDELNACRFCPETKAWYQDPLAAENVADTMQVVGTLAALATFLVGLLLVWRRRRHTSSLLARVDDVAEAHADQRGALLALGRLEEEFAAMFRRHRISDGQYQVLSQRIATVATRFALRTSLGLDDGVPGEGSPATRVDVIDARDKRVRP
jgi:hypothetical protein